MTKEIKGTAENPVEIKITIEEALRDNPKKEEILRFIKEQNQLKKEEK